MCQQWVLVWVQRECEELRRNLEDSRKQLDSNDQMIRWLNNQVSTSIFVLLGAPLAAHGCNLQPVILESSIMTAVMLQVNEAQLHGVLTSKYSTNYRPALNGVSSTSATGISTCFPLR